jgi:hypothetical protein
MKCLIILIFVIIILPTMKLQCAHKICRQTSLSGEKPAYPTVSSLNRHHQTRPNHPCTPEICTCCKELGDNRTGKKCAESLLFCRHKKPCEKFYLNETTLITHEINDTHSCSSECERCVAGLKASESKRKREEIEAEIKRIEEERLQKRKKELDEWKDKITNINWNDFYENTKELYENDYLKEHAKICFLNMNSAKTFEQCFAILLHNDLKVIQYLTDNVELFHQLVTNRHKPSIQVLVALKDKLLISDMNWPYLIQAFEIGLCFYCSCQSFPENCK